MAVDKEFLEQPWYDSPREPEDGILTVHEKLFAHVKQLEEDQHDIHIQNVLHAKLYTNRELMAFNWQSPFSFHFRPLNANLENGIQSVCDTLESRIGTNRPKATIVSRGAEFDVYLKARRLDRFLWGEFVHHDVHTKLRRVFLDACIYGTGFLKLDIDGDELFVDRVHPDEIVVDQRECVSNEMPMVLHHRKLVSRLWLLKHYGKNPDARQKIMECQGVDFKYTSYRTPGEDQIIVVQSWKLAQGPNDTGREVICIENMTLKDVEYKRKRFPFVWLKWAEPQTGFYGRSLVGDLVGYQIRLNELNEVIRFGQDVMCVPRILVEQGSALHVQRFDNNIGKLYTWRGTKPEALVWDAFNAEIYQERERIRNSMFEFAGVSQLSSQSRLPSQTRLDSSEAIREVTNVEDTRFQAKHIGFEEAHKETASHLIELNKILYSGGRKKSRKSTYSTKYLVDQIDWAEVDMEEDRYVLEISASSILNQSPAARKDTLRQWYMDQVINREQFMAWSGQPDLERLVDLMAASKDLAEYQIDKMLDGDASVTPDVHQNLVEAFPIVLDTYQHLLTLDCDDSILDIFVAWMDLAKELMAPAPDPTAQMQPAVGQPPTGGPGMPMPILQ
jgi:hypothetical protein